MGKLVFQSKGVSDKAKQITLICSIVLIAAGILFVIIANMKQSSGTVDIGVGDDISTFSGSYGGGYRLPDSARHTMIFAGIVVVLLGVGAFFNVRTANQSFFKIYTDKLVGQTCAGFWIFTVKRQFEIDYRKITDIQLINNPLIGDVISVKAGGDRYGLLVQDNVDKAYGLIRKIVEYYEKKYPEIANEKYRNEFNKNENARNNIGIDLKKINIPKPEKIKAALTIGTDIEKIIGIICMILLCIAAFRYLRVGIRLYEDNDYAFGFVSESVRSCAYIFYWGVVVVYAGFALEYIGWLLRGKRSFDALLMTGIPMFIWTMIMYIGQHVYEEIEFEDFPIIMYRVFGTYRELTGFSFFVSIVLIVAGFGVVKMMQVMED